MQENGCMPLAVVCKITLSPKGQAPRVKHSMLDSELVEAHGSLGRTFAACTTSTVGRLGAGFSASHCDLQPELVDNVLLLVYWEFLMSMGRSQANPSAMTRPGRASTDPLSPFSSLARNYVLGRAKRYRQ